MNPIYKEVFQQIVPFNLEIRGGNSQFKSSLFFWTLGKGLEHSEVGGLIFLTLVFAIAPVIPGGSLKLSRISDFYNIFNIFIFQVSA